MWEVLDKQYSRDLWRQIINAGGDHSSIKLPPSCRKILSGASDKGEFDAMAGETIDAESVGNS